MHVKEIYVRTSKFRIFIKSCYLVCSWIIKKKKKKPSDHLKRWHLSVEKCMQCITWCTLSLYKYQWARTHQIHQQSTELIVITTRGNSSLCTIIWHMFFDIPYHFSLLYSCFLFSCTHVGASIPSYLISPWQSRGLIGPRLGQRGTVALLVQEAMVRICNGDI